ncbi:466_t:CDS:2, partial [Racocetra persica]
VSSTTWRRITENVLVKAEANGTLVSYYRDHKDKYMCSNCYNTIVVNGLSIFKEHAIEYKRGLKRHREDDSLSMSESIFLLTNIIVEREIIGNDPPIVSFSKLRSITKGKNVFKKDISLFVNLIELLTDAIDALSHAGIMILQRYLDKEKTAIIDNHLSKFHREISLDKKLENITLHKYNDRIRERREERKMKNTMLLDFFELSLKDMNSYINTLQQ